MNNSRQTHPRRKTRQIMIGSVPVGSEAPVSVQSMTNTPTEEVKATLAQIRTLETAGADLIRLSCPTEESTRAFKILAKEASVPLIADIHFHYKRAIEAAEAGAACLRINPGNIGSKDRVKEVVQAAKDYGCAIRIGVNAGSLERRFLDKYKEPTPEALVESALYHLKILEDLDFFQTKISVKASNVFLSVAAYQQLAKQCDYPLHLGITEAGSRLHGTVQSSLGIGKLLWEGIGDTIRVSLSAPPEEEIAVGFSLLKTLNLRHRGIQLISCPSCARQGFDVIDVVQKLEQRLSHIHTPLVLSVLGCVVNGPGEATHSHIGLTGGSNGKHMLFLDGKKCRTLTTEEIVTQLVALVEEKAHQISSQAPPSE